MFLVPTYVAPSAIEGVGLFALEPIAAGALIWQLDPAFDRLIPEGEVEKLPIAFRLFVQRYGYPYPHDLSMLVVELDNGRFMNHSPAPNTRFDNPDAGFALRAIAAGEELTCDYSEFDPGFEILPGRLFDAAGGASGGGDAPA